MSRIVAAEYVTADGVMQDPGGMGEIERGAWSNPYWNDELAKVQAELLFASDALLLGRVTYEGFAATWPEMEDEEGEFAKRMNAMPKYVASRTLKSAEWNASIITGDVPEAVAKLKEQRDRNLLLYGSGALLNTLLEHDLIDQYRIMIHPVVLGQGKRLFREASEEKPLRLVDVSTTSTGVMIADYEPEPILL
ncbi:MAG TPA: dihydrofolate reductase family protein [Acidimicrobiia bacterium]|nr:dihydrofolate reductase family protein [Acidimicrobiia bacterium]